MSLEEEKIKASTATGSDIYQENERKSGDIVVDVREPYFSSSEDDIVVNPTAEPNRIPWAYKWIALLCIVSFPIGTNWSDSSLSPLKSTLRTEMGITNTQFGVISSSDAVVNCVWPIIGGILLDWYGPSLVTPICALVIFLGSLVGALGVTYSKWRVLVAGNIIKGFGETVLDSAQQKFFYHWFGASGFALAFCLENSIASTTSLVSGLTAIPIKQGTGWYGWSFWIPVVFCAFSVIVSCVYFAWEKWVVPVEYRFTSGRTAAQGSDKAIAEKKVSLKTLFELPWAFWMLPATQLLQSGAAGGFNTSSADIIQFRGYTESVAGYLSSAQKILPIVLSPIIGGLVDVYGHRFHLVALAPLFWITACGLLDFSSVHPVVALVFSSLAGTINAMPLQICIPLLLRDQRKIGTAFGVWRAFNNSGSTIVDIAFGVLQDNTPGGGYDRVLKLAIGLKAWAFVLGCGYIFVDWKFLGSGITMTKKRRESKLAVIQDPDSDPLTRRTVKEWVTWSGIGLLAAMLVTAWVVFFNYLIV